MSFLITVMTVWIFAVAYAAESGEQDKNQSCSPLPSTSLYGKTVFTTARLVVDFAGLRALPSGLLPRIK